LLSSERKLEPQWGGTKKKTIVQKGGKGTNLRGGDAAVGSKKRPTASVTKKKPADGKFK